LVSSCLAQLRASNVAIKADNLLLAICLLFPLQMDDQSLNERCEVGFAFRSGYCGCTGVASIEPYQARPSTLFERGSDQTEYASSRADAER
jgi:hypothetical protein